MRLFKNTLIIGLGLVIGGFAATEVTTKTSQASVLDVFLEFLRKGATAPIATTTEGEQALGIKENGETALYKPVINYEEAVVRAVEKAAPSVVSIVVAKDLPVIEQCFYDPFGGIPELRYFFREPFGGFYRPCQRIEKREGGGTGFIITEDGLILTNKHVVFDEDAEYTVLTNDGEKLSATVLARDPVQDIAVIKVNKTGLVPAILGNSDSVKLGQTAIVIGNALGEFRNTVSVGVISGLARTITAGGDGFEETIEGVIQTDAAINRGNSGGPLLNLKGEVIGVNTAIASDAQNIGFAIPINVAKRDVESVKRTGTIAVPYLGVRYRMITQQFAKTQNLPVTHGAILRATDEGPAIVPDSPASKAGLKAEDIIFEINGEKLTEEKTLSSLIQEYSIGDAVTLKVRRGETTLTFRAILEKRPEL